MPVWLIAAAKALLAAVEAYQRHMAAVEALRAAVNAEAKESLATVDRKQPTPKGTP